MTAQITNTIDFYQGAAFELNSSITAFERHRILNIAEVSKLLGRSKSMLYLDMDPKSKYFKADFPKPIKLSTRSIGWKAVDVYEYINSLNQQGSKNE